MSEELYNSNDYCKLAEELEELKKENAELARDKVYLINASMDGGDKYHYQAHDIGYRDLERKVKALEADYVISNRELLVKQVEITALRAEIERLQAERRWIPVGERLPEEKQNVLALDKTGTAYHWEYSRSLSNIFVSIYTHWMPLPEPPEGA